LCFRIAIPTSRHHNDDRTDCFRSAEFEHEDTKICSCDRLSRFTGNRHAVLASYGERERERGHSLFWGERAGGWGAEEGSQNRETGTRTAWFPFVFQNVVRRRRMVTSPCVGAASTCFVLRFAARYHMRRNRNLEYFLFIISSSQFGLIPRY